MKVVNGVPPRVFSYARRPFEMINKSKRKQIDNVAEIGVYKYLHKLSFQYVGWPQRQNKLFLLILPAGWS